MRNGWNGITATTLEEEIPSVERAQLDAMRASVENGRFEKEIKHNEEPFDEAIFRRLNAILNLSSSPRRLTQIDATKSDPFQFNLSLENIWFQCPWSNEVIISPEKADRDKTVGNLLRDFINHFSKYQNVGNFLVIGITMLSMYNKCYRLDDLLKKVENDFIVECTDGGFYQYIGFDDALIEEALLYGYRHKALPGFDIHFELYKFHRSLIFKKFDKR
ncbi:unnamed protein product, partial [Mesorhabditis belari]|uniref:Uncharacterized protein n=1 Tax=Mesorhabditis belari TaxID=2138241 RepID=A0AAF3EM10_9BILA